jgi:hypothetical protein
MKSGTCFGSTPRHVDGVLEAGLFQTQAEMLRLFRLIATMDALAPLARRPEADMGLSVDPCPQLEANQVADRLG